MKTLNAPRIIAIVGGSGSGKSWLADRLQREFGASASRLSLDDFFLDLSHLARSQRERANFDDPRSVDWPLFESVLRGCRAGHAQLLPRYDFATHTRQPHRERWKPGPLVIVDGLWLLRRPNVRALVDLAIYLDCPQHLRWCRRLARDVTQRGREPDSVRAQFWQTVAPMHAKVVAPQATLADLVLQEPLLPRVYENLVHTLHELLEETLSADRPGSARQPEGLGQDDRRKVGLASDWTWKAQPPSALNGSFPSAFRQMR